MAYYTFLCNFTINLAIKVWNEMSALLEILKKKKNILPEMFKNLPKLGAFLFTFIWLPRQTPVSS